MIRPYTKPELERSVDKLLAGMPGVADSAPVPVEIILDKTPDIKRQEVLDLLAHEFGVEAMGLAPTFMRKDLIVVVDSEVMSHRNPAPYHMALAEELGHIHLHRPVMLEVHDYRDFIALQNNPDWAIAERDAKYWGRALLMPRTLLEPAAEMVYRRVANEIGFSDLYQFSALFTAHISAIFEIPPDDAQRRLDGYIGDLRGRLDRSVAARNESLLAIDDTVEAFFAKRPLQIELTESELFGGPAQ